MKHLISILFAVIALTIPAKAQNPAVGIPLGLAVTEFDENFDSAAAKVLSNKLNQILTKHGMTCDAGDFIVIPKVVVLNTDLIEGGMKNIYAIEGEVTLDIKQLSTGNGYGSISIPLKGSGMRFKKEAVKDAVRKIPANNRELVSFFDNARIKIANYFLANKQAIISKARAAAARQDFEQAAAILSTYPEGLDGYEDIDKELVNVMKSYRELNCQQALQQAKSAFAVKNYEYAQQLLAEIDPTSDCAANATRLQARIGQEIRATEAQERQDRLDEKKMAHQMQKARLEAARDVAKAYYQRTQPTYNFVYVR